MLFVWSTTSKIPDRRVPMSCSHQSLDLVISLTLFLRSDLGQREMPSVRVFSTSGIRLALWFHPPASYRRPSILMSKYVLLSLSPPNRVTCDTAALVSPLINIGSPSASGLSPTISSSSMIHAIATIPRRSNGYIVMQHAS